MPFSVQVFDNELNKLIDFQEINVLSLLGSLHS
jgi:hypothetical protein